MKWGEFFKQETPEHIAMKIVELEKGLVAELKGKGGEILIQPNWISRILLSRNLKEIERMRK